MNHFGELKNYYSNKVNHKLKLKSAACFVLPATTF